MQRQLWDAQVRVEEAGVLEQAQQQLKDKITYQETEIEKLQHEIQQLRDAALKAVDEEELRAAFSRADMLENDVSALSAENNDLRSQLREAALRLEQMAQKIQADEFAAQQREQAELKRKMEEGADLEAQKQIEIEELQRQLRMAEERAASLVKEKADALANFEAEKQTLKQKVEAELQEIGKSLSKEKILSLEKDVQERDERIIELT
ncbi:unnamed protein product, partial [Amoebophrya sp. A25]|eukprot:GSA25T00011967001.1